jgi:DNA polymerase
MNADERQNRMHQLDEGIRVCVKCPLHTSRTHAVPGEGPVPADVFFLGEGPGAKEDLQGRPFVGPSGMLLAKLLQVAGLDRKEVYITSCVKCRPPNNRTPHTIELDTCQANWLNLQLELVNPRIVVLLGRVAIDQILHEEGSLARLHGHIVQRDGRRYLPTYHPAAAFRVPTTRINMEEDMIILKHLLA